MRPVKPEAQFARNVRRHRLAAGLKQKELAGRLAVDPSEVSRHESEARNPRLTMILRIADALGVGTEALFVGMPWSPPRHSSTEPIMSDRLCTDWPNSSSMPALEPIEQFAKNLKDARARAGLSQQQLANRSDLHPTEISRLERAVREPRLDTIVRLARGLGIGADRLLRGIR
jgi:transcriptional regulator with XRE-family HTH domain